MAGSGEEKAPIIIKKVNKGGDGHHGGAWKVAYADFVTAMMAFFLLLWLLNVTTAEQKRGIADYFSPASASKQNSGAGGMLGGQTITVSGAMANNSSPMGVTVPVPAMQGAANSEEQSEDAEESAAGKPTEQEAGKGSGPEDSGWRAIDTVNGLAAEEKASADKNRDGKVDEQELRDALAKHEQAQFAKAEAELRQAIQQIPELRDLAQNLIIDHTPEGLRIQLVDQEGYSMFPSGSSKMLPQTAQLMAQVAQAVAKLPNKLSVSGHTDSTPFSGGGNYSNWELSTDRANASRRALEAAGVASNRFETVVGRADRDHLFNDQPNSPRNRRISIVLLRENPVLGAGAGTQPGATTPAATPAPTNNAPAPAPARPTVTPAPAAGIR